MAQLGKQVFSFTLSNFTLKLTELEGKEGVFSYGAWFSMSLTGQLAPSWGQKFPSRTMSCLCTHLCSNTQHLEARGHRLKRPSLRPVITIPVNTYFLKKEARCVKRARIASKSLGGCNYIVCDEGLFPSFDIHLCSLLPTPHLLASAVLFSAPCLYAYNVSSLTNPSIQQNWTLYKCPCLFVICL